MPAPRTGPCRRGSSTSSSAPASSTSPSRPTTSSRWRRRCERAGLELLPIPENYYDDLEARLALDPALVDRLQANGILYDEDERGRYFQIYTRAFRERFFFEVVERDGYGGYGAANAPIRLAAQARLARGPAIPRA